MSSRKSLPTIQKRNTMQPQKANYNFQNNTQENNNVVRNMAPRKSVGGVPFGNQNWNTKEFMQNFSEKLDKHQGEIEARNHIISEMEQNIEVLKKEYMIEKKKSNDKENFIHKLQMQFKNLELKMEEQQTKILHYEREIKKRDGDNSQVEVVMREREELFNKQLNEIASQLEEKTSQLEQQIKFSDHQSSKLEEQEELFKELQSKSLQQLDELNRLKNQKGSSEQREQTLKDQLDSKTQKMAESIKKYESRIDEMQNSIFALEDQLKTHKENNKSNQNIQSQLDEANQNLKQTLRQNQELQEQLQSSKKNEEKVKALEERLKTVKHELEIEYEKELQKLEIQKDAEQQKLRSKNKEFEDKIRVLKGEFQVMELERSKYEKQASIFRAKDEQIRKNIDVIDKNEVILTKHYFEQKEIMKNIKCNHCNKVIKEPVTIIPCGHNFCFDCKTAYNTKKCIKCGPKVKIEAMYRNELLDDIIEMVKIMQNTKDCLKALIITK